MFRRRVCWFALAAALLTTTPARAWDETGHKVVTLIAWQHMTPEARARAVELLRQASWPSGLPQLFPTDRRPLSEREQAFFLAAGIWADLVRDVDFPDRRARYHRSPWHYTNFFWDEEGPDGTPRDREDLRPEPENVVERLGYLQTVVVDARRPRSQRAVDLAWILHLTGDIHQPLHTSARVTPQEPEGDRGGNLFALDGRNNLHGYWDSILSRTFRRRRRESDMAYYRRIAGLITTAYPRDRFTDSMEPGAYEVWAAAGYDTAKTALYGPLRRGREPSESYRRHAYDIAAPAVALAGYRLAEMLNRLIG